MATNDSYNAFIDSLLTEQKETDSFSLKTTYLENQCSLLVDQDVLQSYHLVNYDSDENNCRVDAWGLRPAFSDSSDIPLVLIISDFREVPSIANQPLSTFRSFLDKGKRFFLNSMKDSFRLDALRGESDSVKALADYIYNNRNNLYDVTIIGLTNTRITTRSNTLVISELSTSDFVFHYDIWDFERYDKIIASSKGRESVDINFVDDYGLPKGVKALTAETGNKNLSSFLFVLPGTILFKMYEQWNERLLEQNPRTFLQFAGKVNKGLRATLNTCPDRFFCYNNGLAAVASNVDYDEKNGTILAIENFQIVNGGQTTASIFTWARNAAKRHEEYHLEKVFVMVKMTVIPDESIASDAIPKISEYSNTQNKVSSSAFSIHHEFHKKMEEYSRHIWAPPREETHWYYERVLGQYKNAINLCRTQGEKRVFENQNPKTQMFKTVDMAKYYYAFDMRPDIVCKGAQKCYAFFCDNYLNTSTNSGSSSIYNGTFNEDLFKENCAKALVYKALEKRQGNGVRFVSVPYTIACVMKNLENRKLVLDYQDIWKKQWNNEPLFNLLSSYADEVISLILNTMPEGTSLLSEWAKKPDCWKTVSSIKLDISYLKPFAITIDDYASRKKSSKADQKMMTEAEAQIYVYNKGVEYWKQLQLFINKNKTTLLPIEADILKWAITPGKIVSAKQSIYLLKAEQKAKAEGFDA